MPRSVMPIYRLYENDTSTTRFFSNVVVKSFLRMTYRAASQKVQIQHLHSAEARNTCTEQQSMAMTNTANNNKHTIYYSSALHTAIMPCCSKQNIYDTLEACSFLLEHINYTALLRISEKKYAIDTSSTHKHMNCK